MDAQACRLPPAWAPTRCALPPPNHCRAGAQGEGARAEEQLVRALQQDRSWGDVRFVRQNTRWPPRLYDAYERFLGAPTAS